MLKNFTRNNFHKHTFCIFKEVNFSTLRGLALAHKSASGSSYYFTDTGVYRVSNHWGRAANCRWRLESSSSKSNPQQTFRVGYANWTDFYPNNELEKLFYVVVNPVTKEVSYQHKNNPEYTGEALLRNAADTAKTIRWVKEVLENDNWAKHLQIDNLEETRKYVLEQLCNTPKSFLEIKQQFLK